MKNKSMTINKLRFSLSAIYYCLWQYALKYSEFLQKLQLKLFSFFISLFYSEDSREYHLDRIEKNIKNQNVNYASIKDGWCIDQANRWFRAICYFYAASISSMGLILCFKHAKAYTF